MKRPNPTFLKKASDIRTGRRKRTLIIIGCVLVLALIAGFISYIASKQDDYRQNFPELVGAATSEATATTDKSVATTATSVTETSETDTSVSETEETSADGETDEPDETSATTAQNNEPDVFEEPETVTLGGKSQVLTASYSDRAVYLEECKSSIEKFISDHEDMRISVRYLNLESSEEMGINDITPIVPAGSFAVPIEAVYYESIASLSALETTVTYDGSGKASTSKIASEYSAGKEFYMRTILNYAVKYNDSYALSVITDALGGIDTVSEKLSEISGILPYTEKRYYTDYSGAEYKGAHRTTAYDMTAFLKHIYIMYKNNPETFGLLINDLAVSEVTSPIKSAFAEDVTVLHGYGVNTELCSHIDCAIIDSYEPVALVIYVECEDASAADAAITEMAGYVSDFLDKCYN